METKENKLNEELEEVNSLPEEKPKSKFNPKVLIFGLPIFVVQLIVIYFITANILLEKMDGRTIETKNSTVAGEIKEEEKLATDTANQNLGEHIFQIEDIIVNPANTQGQQLLLSSVAFDVPEANIAKDLEKKQILVKDMIISVLSSKTIHQLSSNDYRDSLRVEISKRVQNKFPNVKINKVYFSKYIIN